ncbi:MOB kinase activator 2-like [Limulus polyphemus]|uniref:MOB kinase activator 2-like n=1 Tax=Limulus polyphemus TaxID=6850 RepID=A0ABM1BPX7_LIMPO|nr:MOB kinase activator 2-like [Limulus polyphemus]
MGAVIETKMDVAGVAIIDAESEDSDFVLGNEDLLDLRPLDEKLLLNNRKTRRKDKNAVAPSEDVSKLYLNYKVLKCTVPVAQLRELAELPPGLDYNEWLAFNTLAFFDNVNLIYGTVSEFCTVSGCLDMTGHYNRQYLWFDEKDKQCTVAAPLYVDYVMTFIQKTVNDESIFPTKFDKSFPSSFESMVKKIHCLLLHIIAHIYQAHFREILLLNLHAHLNTIFSHFMLFAQQFNLLEASDTEVLRELATVLKLYSLVDPGTETLPISKKYETSSPGHEKSTDKQPVSESSTKSVAPENDALVKTANKRSASSCVVVQSVSSPSLTTLHRRIGSGGHCKSCTMDLAILTRSSSCRSLPVQLQYSTT